MDTTTMGGTLERVQLANLQGHPEQFEGKSVKVYGRIESPTSVQHPYYDNSFSQPFASDGAVQAVGARVVSAVSMRAASSHRRTSRCPMIFDGFNYRAGIPALFFVKCGR